jgi:hypothetical protein
MVEYSLHKVCTGFYAVTMDILMPACKVCMPAWEYSSLAKDANNEKVVVKFLWSDPKQVKRR